MMVMIFPVLYTVYHNMTTTFISEYCILCFSKQEDDILLTLRQFSKPSLSSCGTFKFFANNQKRVKPNIKKCLQYKCNIFLVLFAYI